jgi:hypothetical protein
MCEVMRPTISFRARNIDTKRKRLSYFPAVRSRTVGSLLVYFINVCSETILSTELEIRNALPTVVMKLLRASSVSVVVMVTIKTRSACQPKL